MPSVPLSPNIDDAAVGLGADMPLAATPATTLEIAADALLNAPPPSLGAAVQFVALPEASALGAAPSTFSDTLQHLVESPHRASHASPTLRQDCYSRDRLMLLAVASKTARAYTHGCTILRAWQRAPTASRSAARAGRVQLEPRPNFARGRCSRRKCRHSHG